MGKRRTTIDDDALRGYATPRCLSCVVNARNPNDALGSEVLMEGRLFVITTVNKSIATSISSRAEDTLILIIIILTARPEKEMRFESSGKDRESKGKRRHRREMM